VKQISPKVLGTDFSDWAHGACIGVLEEIRLAGPQPPRHLQRDEAE
jgi:hypothetical protein